LWHSLLIDITIRSIITSDYAGVIALWDEVFAGDPPWNDSASMICRKQAVQPELFLVAVQDSRLVGTVTAGYDGVRGWIHRLAVDPSVRRQGVARLLMQAAEDRLRQMDCPKINLQVRATNAEVIAFYRKLGYESEPHVSMAKRLDEV